MVLLPDSRATAQIRGTISSFRDLARTIVRFAHTWIRHRDQIRRGSARDAAEKWRGDAFSLARFVSVNTEQHTGRHTLRVETVNSTCRDRYRRLDEKITPRPSAYRIRRSASLIASSARESARRTYLISAYAREENDTGVRRDFSRCTHTVRIYRRVVIRMQDKTRPS